MYTISSFFAGVGGIDLGFKQTKKFKTIYANEFDKYAAETFELNFDDVRVDVRDIKNVPCNDIPKTDVVIAGFPCQAFSIAGYRRGFGDEKGRGELFFELIRIIRIHKPRVAFFENVKNLVNHDHGNTFKVICNELKKLKYNITYKVLNSSDYGNLSQNRERIYIIAFRNKKDYTRFKWPDPIKRTSTIKDLIDFLHKVDEKYYYSKGKYKGEIYNSLLNAMKDDNINNPSVYQWRRKYVRKNKNNLIPTLTANQGEGGHNVCLIKTKYGIRKMTPRECFNAQGYPKTFFLPKNQSDSRLYKQAGNSVCVPVIRRLAEAIYKSLL